MMNTGDMIYAPLGSIQPDEGGNPRKDYRSADLEQLAASIREVGILHPLLVQAVVDDDVLKATVYHIISGHRRYFAAKLAGLDVVPVRLVDGCSATDIAQLRVIENEQRESLNPMEESDALSLLACGEGWTRDAIAKSIGKSTRYVATRLALQRLPAATQKALRKGELSLGAAVAIARIPNDKTMKAVIAELDRHYRADWYDAADVKRVADRLASCSLEAAQFDIRDPELVPGVGSCLDCPKRSGNDPDLFGDEPEATCNDRDCFKVKTDAVWTILSEQHKGLGPVMSKKEAREIFTDYDTMQYDAPYQDLARLDGLDAKVRRVIEGDKELSVTLARAPSGRMFRLVKKTDLADAFKRAGIKTNAGPSKAKPLPTEARKNDSLKRIIDKAMAGCAQDIIGVIVEKVTSVDVAKHPDMIKVLAHHMAGEIGYEANRALVKRRGLGTKDKKLSMIRVDLRPLVDKMTDVERVAFIVEAVLQHRPVSTWGTRSFSDELVQLAALFKVDHKAMWSAARIEGKARHRKRWATKAPAAKPKSKAKPKAKAKP